MQNGWSIGKRTLKSFYDDQMTHHAAALTYYSLMSLFPALLLALSLLGVIGQYPATYDAILGYLRDVVPASLLDPLDSSLRGALQAKGTAATTLVVSALLALYGTTGVLEAARRALNVVFEIGVGAASCGASPSTWLDRLLLALDPRQPGPGLRRRRLRGGPARVRRARRDRRACLEPRALAGGGADRDARVLLRLLRHAGRPAPVLSLGHAGRRVGVVLWLPPRMASRSTCRSVADVGAIYGAFAGAIVLVAWLWLTNVAMLFGAELNAEIERQKELAEGVPPRDTLNRPARGA